VVEYVTEEKLSFVCTACIFLGKKRSLQNHLPECSQHPAQTVTYPEEGKNVLKLDKIQHMFPVLFADYADFESSVTPSGEHVPSGFCCLRVSKFPQYDHKIHTYSGSNVVQEFLKYVTHEQTEIDSVLSSNNSMNSLTDRERLAHNAAMICSTRVTQFTKSN